MDPNPDKANWFHPSHNRELWGKFQPRSRQKYVWDYVESRTKLIVLLTGLIALSIGVCLFPVWPLWLKRGVHYLLVALLTVMVIFLALRALIFGVVWFFGYEFWILPNVLSEDEELFKPMVSWKRAKGVRAWHRVVAVVVVAAVAYWIVTQPSDFERLVMAQKQFVHDLYSGALLADATQAERDRLRNNGDIDDVDSTAGASTPPPFGSDEDTPDLSRGSVNTDYDHLDFVPDVPLGEEEEEVEVGAE